jgi:hypothetical protein
MPFDCHWSTKGRCPPPELACRAAIPQIRSQLAHPERWHQAWDRGHLHQRLSPVAQNRKEIRGKWMQWRVCGHLFRRHRGLPPLPPLQPYANCRPGKGTDLDLLVAAWTTLLLLCVSACRSYLGVFIIHQYIWILPKGWIHQIYGAFLGWTLLPISKWWYVHEAHVYLYSNDWIPSKSRICQNTQYLCTR